MIRFNQSTIGLELMEESDRFAFFRIADGYAGHTQVLALFNRQPESGADLQEYCPPDSATSSIDHVAFGIAKEHFRPEYDRLVKLGFEVNVVYHHWVQWRSLYLKDPEGNLVELVCFDPQND